MCFQHTCTHACLRSLVETVLIPNELFPLFKALALAGPGEPSIGNAFNVVEALNNHQQAQDGPIVRLAVQEGLEPRLGGKLLARPLLASPWT